MENQPILYYSLTLFFSGFILYAVIQFAFNYFKMPRKETLAPLILSCVSAAYIISDALTSIFSIIIVREDSARFFLAIRELVPVLFFFIVPYFLDRVMRLEFHIKRINHIFFLAGMIIALALIVLAILYPDLLFKNPGNGTGFYNGAVRMQEKGPLITIRNILFLVYLVYVIIVILMAAMHREGNFPGKNILPGLVIVIYFAFNNLYSILFSRNEVNSFNDQFPFLGLGIAVLVLFMGFGIIELFVNYFSHLESITNDLRGELYFDAELEIQNRIGFIKDLLKELDKTGGRENGFSLFYLDVDNFQNINESYGEKFGDNILKMFSRRFRDNFSQAGTLYRIGGDEFAFLVKGIHAEGEAGILASKIMTSLKNPFVVSGIPYTLTASIAILFIPRDGNNIDDIMHNAYSTIRSVKKNKNTFEFFSRDLLKGASNKIYTVDLLRNCISRDEFFLVYQPIVDADGKFMFAEALLRCTNNDPAIGGPDHFIPLIEKAGMMKDLDNLVVRKAFYDVEMKIKKIFSISINMSASQMVDPSYGDFLSLFAKQHGIEPRHIILEITENILVENMALARKSLADLKKNGFLIAIDDFGKGFSSLSYLAELPVDIIKIDMAFVHTVLGDQRKETLVKYIMDLGHSLDLKVVAEGFELPEQVDFFKGLGCDFFQGYYFSRPVQLQDLLAKYLFT